MEFKKGDIIKGLPNNAYGITNEDMTRAKVLKTYGKEMDIEVLEHKYPSHIGETFDVLNSDKRFSLIKAFKPTRQEVLDMPIGSKIIIDADSHNVFIKVGADDWCNDDGDHLSESDIYENLTISHYIFDGSNIVSIEKPTYDEFYNREESVKEMTIAEIEKELGYPVKVIKEDK